MNKIKFFLLFIFSLNIYGKGTKIVPYPAMYWDKLENKIVRCNLCPWHCILKPNERGICRVRKNIKGKLYTLVYGLPCAVHIDPIEKKPLFHFLPSTPVFSIATAGCNLRCIHCQNWEISQSPPEETQNIYFPPEEVVKLAIEYDCPSIAYTYTEPVNFYEYMIETSKLAKEKGIKNTMHTAGFINPEPLRELCKYIDAANVDLKGFNNKFYKEVVGGELEPVLQTLKILKSENVWVEITNLIIPTKNDNPKDIEKMCQWIKDNLGDETPIHFSRFYPMYKLKNLPPTPIKTLEKAANIAKKVGLKYVYIGNVRGHPLESTYCPKCGKILIKRVGYYIAENNLTAGRCKFCKNKIPGIWW